MRAPGFARASLQALSLLALLLLALAPPTGADAQGARAAKAESMFAVKGVAADDVLNIRDAPNGNQIIGHIPPDGRGIVALGPRVKSQGTWVQVRYGGITGWVNVRFLTPDTLQTASAAPRSTAAPRAAGPSALGGEAALRGRLFEGVWSHSRWTLTIDAEQLAFLSAQEAQPARILALGSRECGVVYERNFAAIDVEDIPATFTDPRFHEWAQASTRDKVVAVMIVTCGSLSHRFFFFLTDMHKMLAAEWDERGWLMYEEFSAGSRQVGRQ